MWKRCLRPPVGRALINGNSARAFLKGQAGTEVPGNKISAAHPRQVIVGQQTEAWRYILSQTDGRRWLLVEFSTQIRKMNMIGDTTWSKGKIITSIAINGKYCVDIDVQSINQTGTVTVTGGAYSNSSLP